MWIAFEEQLKVELQAIIDKLVKKVGVEMANRISIDDALRFTASVTRDYARDIIRFLEKKGYGTDMCGIVEQVNKVFEDACEIIDHIEQSLNLQGDPLDESEDWKKGL